MYDIQVRILYLNQDKGKGQNMKKVIGIALLMIIIITLFATFNKVQAAEKSILPEEMQGQLIQLQKDQSKQIEDYKEKYGSDAYGTTAYILNLIRIYSIPLCFLGIAIGAIHQYVIGIRKLDTLEKGMGLIVTFVTILVICQILPLAFAVFVKFGRG